MLAHPAEKKASIEIVFSGKNLATQRVAGRFGKAPAPDPDVLALEIVEELKAALEQFSGIVEELGGDVNGISTG